MGILPVHAQAICIPNGFGVDSAERVNQVDTNRARQNLGTANRALREAHDSRESEAALELLQKVQARIDISE